MPTTGYERITWVGGTTPYSADNMNIMDLGIETAWSTGLVVMHLASTPPTACLLLNGQTVSITEYAALYTYLTGASLVGAGLPFTESGDDLTLPDYRSRFPRMVPSGGDAGDTGGAATHSHTNPSTGNAGDHKHTQGNTGNAGDHQHASAGSHNHGGTNGPSSTGVAGITGTAVLLGSQSHVHTINSSGSHQHASAGTHAHSNPDTNTTGSHQHTVGSSSTVDHQPPYFDIYFSIRT